MAAVEAAEVDQAAEVVAEVIIKLTKVSIARCV